MSVGDLKKPKVIKMEDEEFEKYFEIIQEDIFRAIGDGYYSIDNEEIRKEKLKQILEEIVAKEIDKAIREFYFKEAKP
jgi:hypothetical protein